MNGVINIYDGIIIIGYLLIVIVIGLYSKFKDKGVDDYFLAGRSLNWVIVGFSLFVTNISSEHLIGLAESGSQRGLAVGQYELIAIFLLVLLGWMLAPLYKKSEVLTSPQFFGIVYGEKNRKLFAGLTIFSHIFTKILVTLFAGGILFNAVLGWSLFSSAIIIILASGIYTLIGGFSAVIRTQIFQGILFLITSAIFAFIGLKEIGGVEQLFQKLPADYFQMFKPMDDPEFPWTGILFGAPIIAFWYWCTDNYIVQRILAARRVEDARKGTLFAGLLKILPIFLFVIPGMTAVVLYPELKGNYAYTSLLVSDIIPAGIKGLIIAGFFGAMMSSLSAAFNSIAAVYTIDFYKSTHPDASERTLVLVGRMATIIVVVLTLVLLPFIKIVNNQIYLFLQSTQAYVSAPITAVFIAALFVKNINFKSIFLALTTGELVGLFRFAIESMNRGGYVTNEILLFLININYLHFAILLFVFTLSVMFLFNAILKSRHANPILQFTSSGSVYDKQTILFAGVILFLTIGIWFFFS
ncbi:sodium:solute symporter family transporter [Melioribacter sp. OK-6-Me]|uniref:sodium:solute symporter family transporter n=1 Tax=unclassified Melioribacter TaxID=2627329 RepID=UPI003ED95F4F